MRNYLLYVFLLLLAPQRLSGLSPARQMLYKNFVTTRPLTQKKLVQPLKPLKKRILVLTSSGGGGHTSAATAVKECLQDLYTVSVVNANEILSSLDWVRSLTFHKYCAEDLYNYLIQHNWTWIFNGIYGVGRWIHVAYQESAIRELLSSYLTEHRYDLVISVAPMVNAGVLAAVQLHDIPFIIIPTDLDASISTYGIAQPQYEKLRYMPAFDKPEIRKTFESVGFKQEHLVFGGFPLRASFFKPKDTTALKEEFSIPLHKPVVMILMGAMGSQACFRYARRLTYNKRPLHIVICIGKNEALRERLEKLKFPEQTTVSIVGFTDRIADLMVVADVLITKPGSVSFCEALYTGVYVMLDYSSSIVDWEYFNLEFTKHYGLGEVIGNYRYVNGLLERFFVDDEYRLTIKKNNRLLERKNFKKSIRKEVAGLFEYQEKVGVRPVLTLIAAP
jgi:processive 1,2-diacylglycerol beta-glucosyltransferase